MVQRLQECSASPWGWGTNSDPMKRRSVFPTRAKKVCEQKKEGKRIRGYYYAGNSRVVKKCLSRERRRRKRWGKCNYEVNSRFLSGGTMVAFLQAATLFLAGAQKPSLAGTFYRPNFFWVPAKKKSGGLPDSQRNATIAPPDKKLLFTSQLHFLHLFLLLLSLLRLFSPLYCFRHSDTL